MPMANMLSDRLIFFHFFQGVALPKGSAFCKKVQLILTSGNCLTGKKIRRIIAYRYNDIEIEIGETGEMSTESKPLTLLKAYRIVHNLDTNKICERANISRSYLTRVEQGVTPSAEIAARLVQVLTDVDCVRASQPSNTPNQVETLESARRLVERTKVLHEEFAREGIREIHLLYPKRYQAEGSEHGYA